MKVKFIQDVVGSYGEANTGDKKDLSEGLAHELEASGIVEIIGGDDPKGDDDAPEPAKAITGEPDKAEQIGSPDAEPDDEDDKDAPAERRRGRPRRIN